MPEQLFLPPEYLNWPYTPDGAPPPAPPAPAAPTNPYTDLLGGLGGDDSDKANDRDDTRTSGGGNRFGQSMWDMSGPLARGLNMAGGLALGPMGAVPGAIGSANNLDYINNTRRTLGLPEISTGDYLGGMMPFGIGNDLGSGSPDTKIGDVSIGGRNYTVTPGGGVVDDVTTVTPTEARRRQFWAGQQTANIAAIAEGKPTQTSTTSSSKPGGATKSTNASKKAAAKNKNTGGSREANSDSQSSKGGGKDKGKSSKDKGKGKK